MLQSLGLHCTIYIPIVFIFERMIKMALNAKDARIFIKFHEDGTRDDTRIEGANLEIIPTENGEIYASAVYADGTYDELDLTNYIETSYEDYMLYCGNSPDGKEYRYDAATKKPKEYVHVPTVAELYPAKKAELKAARDAEEVAPLEYNGKMFDYDMKSVIKLNEAYDDLKKNGGTQPWICADNTTTILTVEDIDQIKHIGKVRSNDLHLKYFNLKTQAEAAETVEELNAINW